jgi:ABC-type Fe3+ transport system permease subunit
MTDLPIDTQVIEATFSEQLAVGAALVAVCVVIHGLALFTLQRWMLGRKAKMRFEQLEALSFRGTLLTLAIVFALIFVHFVEIWLFAFLYDYLGALPSFQESLYFSTISYSTVGYSDESISHQWRMVAALESILGIILLGWSTAFFVRFLKRLEDAEPERRKPSGD